MSTEDRCPYCLSFSGVAEARAAGTNFCPGCGADWRTADAEVERSTDYIPPEETGRPLQAAPPADVDLFSEDAATQVEVAPPRAPQPTASRRPSVDVPAPPATARPPGFGPVLGLTLGLLAAIAVPFVYQRLTADPEPPAPAMASPSAAAPTEPRVEPATPRVEPAAPQIEPAAMAADAPDAAGHPPPPVATPTATPAPVDAASATRRVEAVEQAIALLARNLPAVARVEVSVRVEGDVAFLSGRVDSTSTSEKIAEAAANVFGIRAVDTRGLRVVYRHHQVRLGETLTGLARKYYGASEDWVLIWQANPGVAPRPDAIKAGQVILIPSEDPK